MAAFAFNVTGSMSIASNWTPSGTPTAADTVTISGSGRANSGTCNAGSVTIAGAISVNGTATFSGSVTAASGIDGGVFNGPVIGAGAIGNNGGWPTFNGGLIWTGGIIRRAIIDCDSEVSGASIGDNSLPTTISGILTLGIGSTLDAATLTGSLVLDGGYVSSNVVTPTPRPLTFSSGSINGGEWTGDITVHAGDSLYGGTFNGNVTQNGANIDGSAVFNGANNVYLDGDLASGTWAAQGGTATATTGTLGAGATLIGDLTIDGANYAGTSVSGTVTYVSGGLTAGVWNQDILSETYNWTQFGGDAVFNGSVTLAGEYIQGGTFNGPVWLTDVEAYGAVFNGSFATDNYTIYTDCTYAEKISMDGGSTWFYPPTSAEVAPPAAVRAGATNLGVAGTLQPVTAAPAAMAMG